MSSKKAMSFCFDLMYRAGLDPGAKIPIVEVSVIMSHFPCLNLGYCLKGILSPYEIATKQGERVTG